MYNNRIKKTGLTQGGKSDSNLGQIMRTITKIKNATNLISYVWNNPGLRYVTILVSLIFALFLFTNFFANLTFWNTDEKSSNYFLYLPTQDNKQAKKFELYLAQELAKINNMQFVEVAPLSRKELTLLVSEVENDRHFSDKMLSGNPKSVVSEFASKIIRYESGLIDPKLNSVEASTDDSAKSKAFIKWLFETKNIYTKFKKITPYDGIIKKYAKEYGMDWRLIASQMFFESAYKQYSKSFAGAMGLMQITGQTSKDLGLKDPYHAEGNIASGIKYLKAKFDTFKRIDDENRLHFALASYNAGLGHVIDAQKLAVANGLNPYQWKSVSQMLLDLTFYNEETNDADEFSPVKHGFCRGFETVSYVDNIMNRYRAYTNLVFSE
jgi:hypothetical protein